MCYRVVLVVPAVITETSALVPVRKIWLISKLVTRYMIQE